MNPCHFIRRFCLIVTLLIGVDYIAAATADDEKVFARIVASKEMDAQIQAEKSTATAELSSKVAAYSTSIDRLSKPPMSEEKVHQLESELASLRARAANIEQQLEGNKLTDPIERGEKKEELTKARAALAEELRVASLPFEKRLTANRPNAQLCAAWESVLDGCFMNPSNGKFAGITKRNLHWSSFNTGQITWAHKDQKRVCWLSIFIIKKSEENNSRLKLLDGKYPMSFPRDNKSVWVTAGNFRFALSVDNTEWQNEETLTEIFKALIDVDRLAKLKAGD